MLFAAGFGTRMGDLTRDRPKPLVEVAGKPLIDHARALGRGAGCAPVVANLHYRAEMLETHLSGSEVRTIVEAPRILETGGGLRNALPVLGADPVFTLNTDAIWQGPNPLTLLAEAWDPDRMDALLMTVPPARAIGHGGGGDFDLAADGTLRRGTQAIFGGAQILKTERLAAMPQRAFSLNLVWDAMLAEERLFGLVYPGAWCDVGRPEGIALAEDLLERGDV